MMRRSCFGLLFLEAGGGGVLEMEGSKPPVDAGVLLELWMIDDDDDDAEEEEEKEEEKEEEEEEEEKEEEDL